MPDDEKLRKKAEKVLDKAELLFDNDRNDKAGKEFAKAAEMFFKLEEYKIAEKCYFYAAKSFVKIPDYLEAAKNMRDAATCCILYGDISKAAEYYSASAKYALKSGKLRKEAEFRSILAASFAYLCWFIKGKQDKGLGFIKKIKKQVSPKEFIENRLIKLVKGLTAAIINKNDSALKEVEREFINYKFRPAELILIKNALILARAHLMLKFKLDVEQTEILNEARFKFGLEVDFSGLKELADDPFLQYTPNKIMITDIGAAISDNIAVERKPKLPVEVTEDKVYLEYRARANFPGKGYIGPILLTVTLDGDLVFFAKSPSVNIMIKSPPAKLGITLKPMINPMINRTFPMEVTLYNPSEADVSKITVEFEFPRSLRLMRGTTKKEIYQIPRNDSFKWQISLKPLEPGKHIIKATVSFYDQDGNLIGPSTAEIPFEINL